jgi:LysR family transcriptional activator of glutamate synthase operon
MELRDLRYFLACVEHGSVTAAARAVHVAQPTLSHALGRLEREAEVRLLERRPGDRLRPTPAGRMLMARAQAALASVDAFAGDLAALHGLERGELLVASIQSLNATLLPAAIAGFVARYPGVALGVRTHPAEAIADAVRHGAEELGFVAGAPPETLGGLVVKRLYQERFVAIVHRADPLARRGRVPMAALRDRPLALVPAGTYTATVIHSACERAGFIPRVAVTLDSGEGLREIVRAGRATTVLPERYLPRNDQQLRAVRLTDPTPARDVLALRNPARHATAAADAFLRLVEDSRAGRGATPGGEPPAAAT